MTTLATEAIRGTGVDQRPWVSYGRISKRKRGDGAGAYVKISAQHDENTAYIQALAPGAEVIRLDDNMSAWDPDTIRPQWEQALEMVRTGQVAGIVGWHADRLTRQPLQGEQLLAACKKARTQLHITMAGQVTDPLTFRILGAVAASDSDRKSEKIAMKHRLIAQAGGWHGGPRPYGYDAAEGHLTIRESEAHWVRWAAQGLLGGRSLAGMARELNEKGITTATGKQWTGGNLGLLLQRPALAGLRSHGKDDQGRPVIVGKAAWDPILDPQTYEAVCSLLRNPERRTSKSQARRYLLSGVARCGGCGAKLRGRSNGRLATAAAYFCDANGCVSRRQDYTDLVVIQHVVARLSQVDARGLLTAPEDGDERALVEAQKQRLQGNLDAMAEQAAMGTITMAMLLKATERIQREVAGLDDQLAQMAVAQTRPQAVLDGLAGASDVQAVWDGLGLDHQRAVVDVLCSVTVLKAPRKGAGFDPELVQVTWK